MWVTHLFNLADIDSFQEYSLSDIPKHDCRSLFRVPLSFVLFYFSGPWCSRLDFFDCPFYSSSSIALFLLAYFMFLFSPNVAFFLPVPVLTGLAMQAALLRGPRIQSEGRNQLSH